eukprot:3325152-Lingulodinium_polyedra.AAC.1
MADAGAVFFADQLTPSLQLVPVPPAGAFLWNCPKMDLASAAAWGSGTWTSTPSAWRQLHLRCRWLNLLKCST